MRPILAGCCALILFAEGVAAADAHHQILSHSPIQDHVGAVVGFRATLLVDPQKATTNHATLGGDVRLGLGGMKRDLTKGAFNTTNYHRDAIAGVAPGYLLHQFKIREITGPNPTDRGPIVETLATGGAMKEVEVEVLYKDNPSLIPGTKVDLVAGFWKNSYWHIWGAADGPMHSSQDFVIQLPGAPNRALIDQHLQSLNALLPKAQADQAAAQQQHDVARQAYTAGDQLVRAADAQRQAAAVALQQVTAAANAKLQAAMNGPQADNRKAVLAIDLAYQTALRDAKAQLDAAVDAAQKALDAAGKTPAAQQIHQQAFLAANTTHRAAVNAASTIQRDALAQANATLSQASTAANAVFNQDVQAAKAQLAAATTAYNTASTDPQWIAARGKLRDATAAKKTADDAVHDLNVQIAKFQQLLPIATQ